MNQKSAMASLAGVFFILLIAATASARDKVIYNKPVSAITTRDRGSLSQVLSASTHERAESESSFQAKAETARADGESVRALHLDIGDELGGSSSGSNRKRAKVDREFYMKAKVAAKELDGEWKEVNQAFRPRRSGAAQVAKEAKEYNAGGSSASVLPASRTQKSAQAE